MIWMDSGKMKGWRGKHEITEYIVIIWENISPMMDNDILLGLPKQNTTYYII